MTQPSLPPVAPCIVDIGLVIHKPDMHRLLADLGHVHYIDMVDGQVRTRGEGYVMEVFSDSQCATLVVNRTLYLNVCSFDYLRLDTVTPQAPSSDPPSTPVTPHPEVAASLPSPQTIFDLVQDGRVLRLIPLSHPLAEPIQSLDDVQALEAAVADVLAANWEVRLEDSDELPGM